jgi:hypothetical protein
LEARELLSRTPITDMTQWAAQFGTQNHTQVLALNFDGDSADGVSPFVAQAGKDRDAAIQDILYRVSELFSPFNVSVFRTTGNGAHSTSNGDSTIFIGGKLSNLTKSGSLAFKNPAGGTPAQYSDYGGPNRGWTHAPNSDPFDLAFIDPMQWLGNPSDPKALDPTQWTNVWGDQQIAQAVAHEAGHTFGLAHVLGGAVNDVMSYNSSNQYFANKTLPITTLNYNASTGQTTPTPLFQPQSYVSFDFFGVTLPLYPVNITQQNSFTDLQTALGARYSDGYAHWSDAGYVDPASTNNATAPSVWPGSVVTGYLARAQAGDYDVYKLTAAKTEQVHLTLQGGAPTGYQSMLLVHDSSGNLVEFATAANTATAAGQPHIDFQANAGQTYSIVVGVENGWSLLNLRFRLSVTATDPVPNLVGATFTFHFDHLTSLPATRLVIQYEDVNTGFFSGVYYNYIGMGVTVGGTISNTTHNAAGVSTSTIGFGGMYYWSGIGWESEWFTGTLTGSGKASPTGWADTLSGTLVDFLFLNDTAHGKDF